MAKVAFYEKPGCLGAARQKQALRRAGHEVNEHDLLSEPWTAARLKSFFGARPVADWFNRSAPRVKSGEIAPERLGEEAALALMLADPLLIRRPLLQSGDRREVGFEPALIEAWLGLDPAAAIPSEGCPRDR
ncbi:MAG: ArsC/Spx/MgsR family protein [Pseudomonadota bacterium]